jgi:hypothetical protein
MSRSLRLFAGFAPAILLLLSAIPAVGHEAITLSERFNPGSEYRVVTRVEMRGELMPPGEKDRLKMHGRSFIEYDERILPTDGKTAELKALRIYRTIDFKRLIGDKPQEISLRPNIRRMVMMKSGHAKVPFSPDGPLTWGEIDMLRTDIFVPALAGLLPPRPVKAGDSWRVSEATVAELTDMDRVEKGDITAKFEVEESIDGKKVAHVTLNGDLHGVNEDGPNRQKISGRLYFDLREGFISYLSINGEHFLLDKDGKENGKMSGDFVMVRRPGTRNPDLADAAVAKLTLEPNADNTLLLYEDPDYGVRFLHPRRWRVARSQRGQITLDESKGSGLLITLDALPRIPTTDAYVREAQKYLKERKATVLGISRPARLTDSPNELDQFHVDADDANQRITMAYLIARQEKAGATFAARILEADRDVLMKEIERIARSLTLSRKLDSK